MDAIAETNRAEVDGEIAIFVIGAAFMSYFIWGCFVGVRELLTGRPHRLARAGNQLLRIRDLDGAIAKYSEAIAKQPSNVEAHLGRSSAYIRAGEAEKAIADCTTLIELDGRNHHAYLNRGSAHQIKNDYEQAIADFSKSIELQPKCAEALFNRGYILTKLDSRDEALEDLSQVILLVPSNSGSYLYRAYNYLKNDDFGKAIADLSKAIDLGSTTIDPHRYRAYALSQSGDFERAVSDYETALRNDPDDAEALNGVAWILATCPISELRDGARAIKTATRSCEILNYAEWYCVGTLAAAFAEANKFDEAFKWATESLTMAPDDEKQACSERLQLYKTNQPYRMAHSAFR